MNHKFQKEAWSVLINSAKTFGFVATAQDKDNYARLWSRDSAIASLAVLSHGKEALYPVVKSSILNLLEAVGVGGVFPSNVSFNADGEHELSIALDFLEEGATYEAQIYRDADDADWEINPYAVTIETKTYVKDDSFDVRLGSCGGFVAILVKQ